MYAVLSSGGKQYRVEAGTTLMLERREGGPGEAGAQVTWSSLPADHFLLLTHATEWTSRFLAWR